MDWFERLILGIGLSVFYDRHHCHREHHRRHPHLLPVELADAGNLRDQGDHHLAGLGRQLTGGDSVQVLLIGEVLRTQ